jgi:uncharacterized damage-inducible protein DinB
MSQQRTLRDLYAYNAWANGQVFALCAGQDVAQMESEAPGTSGSIAETLKHLIGVEAVYLQMLRDVPLGGQAEREAFWAHDLPWFTDLARQLGGGYQELLARADDAFFDQPLAVPWFDFALTKHDGLLQVLAHSAQHRAQVLSALGQRGVEVPDVDYVLFVKETKASAT